MIGLYWNLKRWSHTVRDTYPVKQLSEFNQWHSLSIHTKFNVASIRQLYIAGLSKTQQLRLVLTFINQTLQQSDFLALVLFAEIGFSNIPTIFACVMAITFTNAAPRAREPSSECHSTIEAEISSC